MIAAWPRKVKMEPTDPTPTQGNCDAAEAVRIRMLYEKAVHAKASEEFFACIEHAQRETRKAIAAAREDGAKSANSACDLLATEIREWQKWHDIGRMKRGTRPTNVQNARDKIDAHAVAARFVKENSRE